MSLLSSWLLENPSILKVEPNYLLEEYSSNYACMNWRETKDAHIYEFELPGVTKDDVKLELHEGNVLRISAERKEEDDQLESKEEKWHCKERPRGSFSRQFKLPQEAKVDEIKAQMNNGVLIVTVPKDQELLKKLKKGKHHHQYHTKVVPIQAGHGDDQQEVHGVKGLGRFVCCKA